MSELELEFVRSHKLRRKKGELREPSGLSVARDGRSLWVVSDDTKRVFRISLDGGILEDRGVEARDLEGIAAHPGRDLLLAVQEEANRILELDARNGRCLRNVRLADLEGFEPLAASFAGDANKGLEGVAFDADGSRVFVLKEADPVLLIELDPDLERIVSHRRLGPKQGFVSGSEEALDASGLAPDEAPGNLWIVSDRGRRVVLYDWGQDRVVGSASLPSADGGLVEKPEGVAYVAATDRLYVVSDKKARLYVYRVRRGADRRGWLSRISASMAGFMGQREL